MNSNLPRIIKVLKYHAGDFKWLDQTTFAHISEPKHTGQQNNPKIAQNDFFCKDIWSSTISSRFVTTN